VDDRPSPPRASTGKTIAIGLAVLGGFALPVIAIAMLYRSCLGTTVRGSVALRGVEPELRRRLGACAAEADGRAVVIRGPDDVAVRAVVDPIDGPRVELSPPDQRVITLVPATCPGLSVLMRVDGKRDDGSAILAGSATARCPVPAGHPWTGAMIEFDAWWKGCRLPEP
jgi:hypothetical protein